MVLVITDWAHIGISNRTVSLTWKKVSKQNSLDLRALRLFILVL